MFTNKLIVSIVAISCAIALWVVWPSSSKEIGEVSTKFNMFSSNDTIIVESFDDNDIKGVSCVISRAKTGGMKGMVGVAEDGSDAAISCVKTSVLKIPENIKDGSKNGSKVFSKSTSILFKSVQVVRFYDTSRNIITYMVYSDKLIEGSPNNSISAVYSGNN